MADLRTRIIITSDDQSRQGLNSAREGLSNLQRQVTQARNALLGLFGVSLGAGLIKDLIKTADEFKLLNSAIKLSTRSEQEFGRAQEELFAISQRTGTGLRENVDLFRRVSSSVRDMGGSQERAFNIIELIGKSVVLSGVSAETSAAGIMQFNQGLGSGVLRGEEFNSVMENTPRLAEALADGLQSTKAELRAMAEQGKLTSEVVLQALESQAEKLNSEFKQVPATVGQALVRVGNAWTVFLGRLNEGSGATASIAKAFNTLAANMRGVVETGVALAKVIGTVYAAKVILGIQSFIAAQYQGIIASREAAAAAQHEAIVQIESMRVKAAATALSHRLAEAALREAYANKRAAFTMEEQIAARKRLALAITAEMKAREAAVAASLAYNNALNATAVTATRAERAMKALNNAFFLFIAFKIGEAVGEWLNQFERIRVAGSYVAQTMVLMATGAKALLDGLSTKERFEQIRQINTEFEQIRANSTDAAVESAQKTAQAEELKAKVVEDVAERQKQAWKQVEEGLKALTSSIDTEFSQQTAVLKQQLEERLAVIDAGNTGELEKDAQRTQALVQSAQAELELAGNTANAKLQLIYQSYGAQIQGLTNYNDTAKQLDRESGEARKEVYTDLAKHYQSVVDSLTQEHHREVQSARQTGQQIRDLATQHQFDLADIERQGVDARKRIESEKSEFDRVLAEANAEIAKGQAADQDKINALLGRAKELSQDLANSTINLAQTDSEKSSARSANADRINKLYEAQKTLLENNKKAHEDNADALKNKQQEAADKLAEVNIKLASITEQLNKDYALQISADTSAIDAAIEKINSIPTEKTVVIKTVNQGEAAETAQQHGGPVQRFAGGGWPRLQGRLPGFGGGDKVRALLEQGEWIIRKEAVRKIESAFGEGSMAKINQGILPIPALQQVIARASGGRVDVEPPTDREKRILENILGNMRRISLKQNTAGFADFDPRQAMRRIEPLLRQEGMLRFRDQLNQLIPNLITPIHKGITSLGISDRQKQINRAMESKAVALKAQLFSGKQKIESSLRVPVPKLPSLSIPAPSLLPISAGPASSTLLQAAQGAPDKMVRVEFQAPGGQPVTGQFNEKDMDKLFKALKDAGLRTSGGYF